MTEGATEGRKLQVWKWRRSGGRGLGRGPRPVSSKQHAQGAQAARIALDRRSMTRKPKTQMPGPRHGKSYGLHPPKSASSKGGFRAPSRMPFRPRGTAYSAYASSLDHSMRRSAVVLAGGTFLRPAERSTNQRMHRGEGQLCNGCEAWNTLAKQKQGR